MSLPDVPAVVTTVYRAIADADLTDRVRDVRTTSAPDDTDPHGSAVVRVVVSFVSHNDAQRLAMHLASHAKRYGAATMSFLDGVEHSSTWRAGCATPEPTAPPRRGPIVVERLLRLTVDPQSWIDEQGLRDGYRDDDHVRADIRRVLRDDRLAESVRDGDAVLSNLGTAVGIDVVDPDDGGDALAAAQALHQRRYRRRGLVADSWTTLSYGAQSDLLGEVDAVIGAFHRMPDRDDIVDAHVVDDAPLAASPS